MTAIGKTDSVAEVLQHLKEEIRKQRSLVGSIPGSTAPFNLEQVHATSRVNPHLPIAWPRWPAGIVPKLVALAQKVTRRLLRWYINPIVEQQNAFNAAVTRALEALTAQLQQTVQWQTETESRLTQLQATWEDRLAQFQATWEAHLAEQGQAAEITSLRLQRLERARQEARATVPASGMEAPLEVPPIDYFHLGLKHRGPSYLQEQQKIYLNYFRGCQNVLDIGCGRGEFVGLLRENGIGARGIDLDADAVAHAKEEGLPVEQAEALAYLTGLPDQSLDGVFMAQVVEHLTPPDLLHLLNLCCRKMKPGVYLVVETINPTCLWALANWYLVDPSHVRPVHPETLRFLLEGAGFWKVQLRFLTLVPPQDRLQPFPLDAGLSEAEQERLQRLNRNIERVNTVLFGYQDYAAIAQCPPEDLTDVS
ncbi:MAG: methyltransferase domain-containing protein [Chloroflexi bacterium]|nr:methyltransferase domain-containing protein [Chloroflexota bacterium]